MFDDFGAVVSSDAYVVSSRKNTTDIVEVVIKSVTIELATTLGSGPGPFPNPDLPLTPPALTDFDRNKVTIEGDCVACEGFITTFRVTGTLDTLFLVPEPATGAIVGLGLMWLARPAPSLGSGAHLSEFQRLKSGPPANTQWARIPVWH